MNTGQFSGLRRKMVDGMRLKRRVECRQAIMRKREPGQSQPHFCFRVGGYE
jgi:hypothetical protein